MTSTRRVIGVDESGKGDFFGPLVIASFLSSDADLKILSDAGVRDGKGISENRLLQIDLYLRQNYQYSVTVISPHDYNRRYKKIRNLNKLLAEGHAEVIDDLSRREEADLAISDKFGKTELVESALARLGCDIDLKQMVRGEKVLQVAAASIMARAEFIRQMKDLSTEYTMEIPRGAAAHVDAAGRKLVSLFGVEVLSKVAKLHFKNYQRVVNPDLFAR